VNETRQLVDFSVRLRYEDLPARVVERAKLCVLDIVGVALSGGQHVWGQAVAEFVKGSGGRAESAVWGKGWRTSAQYAALINGTGAHGIEMDDRSATLSIHCGAAVVPAAIAAAEKAEAKGKDLIVAVVLGYEIAYRVSRAVLGLPKGHFYASPIKTLPGVTVAASKLLGLDNSTMLNALGIAGSMGSGLQEWEGGDPSGTMVKRFQGGGWPAHNGVMAALLASKGLSGPGTILEGKHGLCRSFAIDIEPKMGELVKDLGEDFQIMQREIKPYAAWGGSHASIDAVNELVKAYSVKSEQIESIEIGGSSKMLKRHEEKRPQSLMAAQYSLPFITALAFFQNLADPSAWNDQTLNRPEVMALAQKVNLRLDDELQNIFESTNDYAGVKMTIRLKNGCEHKTQIRYSRGTIENPASAEDIHEKFKVMASHVFPAARVEKAARLIDQLEEMDNVISLSKALT